MHSATLFALGEQQMLLKWEGENIPMDQVPCPLLLAGTYSVQWAAVSTQQGWISAPPQKWPAGMKAVSGSEVCKDTCHGCLPAVLLKPP